MKKNPTSKIKKIKVVLKSRPRFFKKTVKVIPNILKIPIPEKVCLFTWQDESYLVSWRGARDSVTVRSESTNEVLDVGDMTMDLINAAMEAIVKETNGGYPKYLIWSNMIKTSVRLSSQHLDLLG